VKQLHLFHACAEKSFASNAEICGTSHFSVPGYKTGGENVLVIARLLLG